MGQVGGRFVHAAFVLVVEMPMHICSHSPWWVTDCQLEMLPPLVRALGLKIFFYITHKGGISSKRQRRRHTGILWRQAWMKEGQTGGVSAGACASHRPMEHGSPPQTQHRPLLSVSLHTRNLLSQCMLSCTPKRAPHNYAYQIMHTFPSGEHCNYLDVAPGLQPQTTTQLQGNETLMMMMIAFIITLEEIM